MTRGMSDGERDLWNEMQRDAAPDPPETAEEILYDLVHQRQNISRPEDAEDILEEFIQRAEAWVDERKWNY